jgi:hypothetical protein
LNEAKYQRKIVKQKNHAKGPKQISKQSKYQNSKRAKEISETKQNIKGSKAKKATPRINFCNFPSPTKEERKKQGK